MLDTIVFWVACATVVYALAMGSRNCYRAWKIWRTLRHERSQRCPPS
jgi:hypothetical protein